MCIVCIFVDQYHYFISIRCQFRSSCKALQDKHEPHRLYVETMLQNKDVSAQCRLQTAVEWLTQMQ